MFVLKQKVILYRYCLLIPAKYKTGCKINHENQLVKNDILDTNNLVAFCSNIISAVYNK